MSTRRTHLGALALALPLVLAGPVVAAAAVSPTVPVAAPVVSSDEESPSPEGGDATEYPEDATPPEVPGLEPIDGGPDGDQAVDITAGRYVDVMPEKPEGGEGADAVGFNVYDYERTIPGSIIRWGLTFAGDDVRSSSRVRSILVRPLGEEGTQQCGAVVRSPELYATTMPMATFGGTSFPGVPACVDADVLRIGVFAPGKASPPPGTPYELSVWEVPPPDNLQDLTFPSQVIGGERIAPVAPEEVTTAVEAGPSKQEASPVPEEDGGVHVDLPLGQVSWFAVPVETNALLGVDAAVEDVARVNQGAALEVKLVAPEGGFVGATVRGTEGSAGTFDPTYGQAGVVGTGVSHVQAQTYSVGPGSYKDLEPTAFSGGGIVPSGPSIGEGGLYYVAVYVQDLTGGEVDTLPLTLTIGRPQPPRGDIFGVEAEYAEGYPDALPGPVTDVEPTEYDGAAAAEELEQRAAEEESSDADEAGADDGGGIPWWVYVLGVLVVLAIAAGAFLLARRGRSAGRRASGPQGPQGPQGGPWQQGGPGQQGPGPSYGQGPPPGWGPPQGPYQGQPQGPYQGQPQGPPPQGPPGPSGPPTPPTQIRQGPHPGQSGEWSGRPGQPQRQQPPSEGGSWSPPEGGDGR